MRFVMFIFAYAYVDFISISYKKIEKIAVSSDRYHSNLATYFCHPHPVPISYSHLILSLVGHQSCLAIHLYTIHLSYERAICLSYVLHKSKKDRVMELMCGLEKETNNNRGCRLSKPFSILNNNLTLSLFLPYIYAVFGSLYSPEKAVSPTTPALSGFLVSGAGAPNIPETPLSSASSGS